MNETTVSSTYQERSSFVIIGLVLLAWGILSVWSLSPYAGLLDHHTIGEGDLPLIARLALFLIGWLLMVIAMMFPASFFIGDKREPQTFQPAGKKHLSPPYLLGYLAVWIVFGGFIYLGDAALHEGVEQFAVLNSLSPGIMGSLLLLVGGYQFTSAKRTCLVKDHIPHFSQGELHNEPQEKFSGMRMGLRHGFYCLGSCGGLMLLMFAAGSMNLLAMLGMTAIMVAEQAAPTRWQLSRLVGFGLIALACVEWIRIL